MKFGAIFPSCEIGSDPAVIRDWARAAEELGYSHIVTYDHAVTLELKDRTPPLMTPYTEQTEFHEAFVLLSYLAAVTTNIELQTGVLQLPQRQTVLVAKQAAELALLSEGRFRLGVGTGFSSLEYQCLGASFEDRGRMLDEQVELLRTLWGGGVVDYDGDFHRVDRAAMVPAPPSPIPIWFGGRSAAAIRRAAAVGDGFIFSPGSMEPVQNLCRHLVAALDANGRREGFGIDVLTGFGAGPEQWHKEIDAWEALGADSLSMRTMTTGSVGFGEKDPGFMKPRQHIDALEQFMREVR